MKNIKKLISVFLFIMLLAIVTINCSAAIMYDNITVVFEDDSVLSDEEKEHLTNIVLDYHINGCTHNETSNTYGLMCTLFGHDEVYNSVSTIEHKVSDTQPRCYRTEYDVITCSRCDYESITPVASYYYSCCPND